MYEIQRLPIKKTPSRLGFGYTKLLLVFKNFPDKLLAHNCYLKIGGSRYDDKDILSTKDIQYSFFFSLHRDMVISFYPF